MHACRERCYPAPYEAPVAAKRPRTSEADTKKRIRRTAAVGLYRALRGAAAACTRGHATTLHRSTHALPPAGSWQERSRVAVGCARNAAMDLAPARSGWRECQFDDVTRCSERARDSVATRAPADGTSDAGTPAAVHVFCMRQSSMYRLRSKVAFPPSNARAPSALRKRHLSAFLAAPGRLPRNAWQVRRRRASQLRCACSLWATPQTHAECGALLSSCRARQPTGDAGRRPLA